MEENIDILIHDGVAHDENPPGRGSGRYPWGSGDKAFQRPHDFLDRVNKLKAEGKTEQEVALALGILARDKRKVAGSPTRLRATEAVAKNEKRLDLIRQARALSEQGVGPTEGAKRLGLPNESSFRSLVKEGSEHRSEAAIDAAKFLEGLVDEGKGNLIIAEGLAQNLNISENRLNEALEIAWYDGYELHPGRVPYPTNPKLGRTIRVLCPPGTPDKAGYDYANMRSIENQYISHDSVTLRKGFEYPASMDSKRLMVRYGDEGGIAKDGLVEIRPGVKDLDLGCHYAQVRILVDDTHYIKGMAVYGKEKDFPEGVDVIFNTNKPTGTPLKDPNPKVTQVLKNIDPDPTNPFKTSLKLPNEKGEHGGQSYWKDDKGVEHLSLINKRAEEGDWDEWSKELASQFLSKQPRAVVNKQLNLTEKQRREELDEIKSLTNDTVKRVLLNKYADTVDGQAVSLKAAPFPKQRYQVILPLTTIKDNEIYAPNFNQGETVSLVRFPHAGIFEIPTLTVNNNLPEGNRVITKDASDAVGISANVAKILSGADFDGDTVLVIPHVQGTYVQNRNNIPLEGLKNFDPELEYGDHEGNVHMRKDQVQRQMGEISNLITDMTIAGAPDVDITKAVRHSMVVIDSVKHKYDYKQSEADNEIKRLKHDYQVRYDDKGEKHHGGASTIISRAKSPVQILERKEGAVVIDPKTGKSRIMGFDPETGEKLYRETGGTHVSRFDPITKKKLYLDKVTGLYKPKNDPDFKPIPKELTVVSEPIPNMQETSQMAKTKDAMTLVSFRRNPIEIAYANYANYLKALANEARRELVGLKEVKYSPSAHKAYAQEVKSLEDKYKELQKRRTFEATADIIANENYKAWLWSDDHFFNTTDEQKTKQLQRLMTQARYQVGLTKRMTLEITPKEWEAIQAGAIGSTKLAKMLGRADLDVIKSYATPRNSRALTASQINRIKSMAASGKGNAEIAEALGINVSTVIKYKGEE